MKDMSNEAIAQRVTAKLRAKRIAETEQLPNPNEEYRKAIQKEAERYKADTSTERLTEEETRMLYSLWRRRRDGDLSTYVESVEELNSFRLTEFFDYLPYAMATLGQHQEDTNVAKFIPAMAKVVAFLFYIAEVRDSYRCVADFLREYEQAERAYILASTY